MSLGFLVCFSTGACLVRLALGQVFVGTNSSEASIPVALPAPDNLSSGCNSTFATKVTCDLNLPPIAFGGYFPDSDDLTLLCTSDCLQSLEALRNSQEQSCASDIMVVSGVSYPVTATIDTLLWTYNYTCRRDATTGVFCAPIFDAWADGTASDQSCTDCVLGTYQLQLGYSEGYDVDLASNFSLLTSSCQATGYPVTSPPPNYINDTTTTATATVTGTTTSPSAVRSCVSTYAVKAGDDCHSISTTERVSTNQLLYLNNLEAGCTDFPAAGAQLCMPHTCDVYTVQQNDTCWGITEAHNSTFTISQLVSWNIDISRGCDNLELLEGSQVCVSFPGDAETTITATAPASTATVAPIPDNVVDGTNTRCARYYEVVGGDTCAGVTNMMGISLADLYFLNPEINSTTCDNLFLGYSYCVAAVGDIATYPGYAGSPTNPCVGGTGVADPTCYATTYSTVSEAWTFPAVNTTGASTSPTVTYTSYTITTMTPYPIAGSANPTPTPYQSGMLAGCERFYFVVANDTCYDIAQRWSISLDQLYAWNPDLHTDCSGLILGEYICVGRTGSGGSTTTAVPTATSTAGGGGTAPPGPTQAGIPADCNKWVMQKDGVYCYDMAAAAGISLPCLYQINPALNTGGECAGLWAGYAYCIGTVSGQCT